MLFSSINSMQRCKIVVRQIGIFCFRSFSSLWHLVRQNSRRLPCGSGGKSPYCPEAAASTFSLQEEASPWLPGGNGYDDMRIDLVAAYALQDLRSATVITKSASSCWLVCKLSFCWAALLQKAKISEPLAMSGFSHRWFDGFEEYWRAVLGGRPLCLADFHALRHSYRVKVQKGYDYEWDTSQKHLENWQLPHNIYSTFSYVYKAAIRPISAYKVFRYLQGDMRVLEYGCSLAPFYRNWRSYFSYIRSTWTLMDIANFPFHYARYLYMGDDAVESMPVISPNNFDAPIAAGVIYDFIIVTTVFEHLHRPLTVARHLVDHLAPGGFFVFDYVLSQADELDTPGGLAERLSTLKFLSESLILVRGCLEGANRSVGLCICQKPFSSDGRG